MTDNTPTEYNLGLAVLCDFCNKDWNGDPTSGGFIFQSKGVCPDCAPEFRELIVRNGEECYIRAECPPDKSHAEFIHDYRERMYGTKEAKITVYNI